MNFSIKNYSELINYLNQIWSDIDYSKLLNTPDYNLNNCNNPLCFSNQFYCFIKAPHLNYISFSQNISSIIGVEDTNMHLKDFLKKIHLKDQEKVIKSYCKTFYNLKQNYHNLKPLKCLSLIDFYIRKETGEYIKLLQQTCIYNFNRYSKELILLFIFTDITDLTPHFFINQSTSSSANHKALDLFTKRELEILDLLSNGKSSHEIADDLSISKHTVDTHRRKMLSKSKLGNTAELIAYTFSKDFVQ
ncbi:helix-turn-helix domain-containing protein [Plebeiibacterium sediminum]|uniref:Helix-turn-helix transcriptional regulator n=1 Tax=Plebeiibacterium sediminum TaxID=2992112 RepID=A0AAE3M899_9BACT|nr:helix-turn-helix transcriptional regulator [Plebeiobacterium sediminum]MCW3789074.1 helix-turn-helix transcriptional regulator [Plebeiobacterium sediminum]